MLILTALLAAAAAFLLAVQKLLHAATALAGELRRIPWLWRAGALLGRVASALVLQPVLRSRGCLAESRWSRDVAGVALCAGFAVVGVFFLLVGALEMLALAVEAFLGTPAPLPFLAAALVTTFVSLYLVSMGRDALGWAWRARCELLADGPRRTLR